MKQVDIKNFDNYQITDDGRVWSKKTNKYLKPSKDRRGYYFVFIRDNNGKYMNKRIHRLIAEAFIPNPDNKQYIDHINTIKTDNRICNLRWCTLKENNNNPISKQKLVDYFTGCKLSDEHKKKISEGVRRYLEEKKN